MCPAQQLESLRDLAWAKMARVLGADRATQLLSQLTSEMGIELSTPDELLALAERMKRLHGFEGAVGGMLGVAAVLRGAAPKSDAT